MEMIGRLIRSGRKNRPDSRVIKYITIHETDNHSRSADALAYAAFLDSDAAESSKESWHYTVDEFRAVSHIPDGEKARHTGKRRGDRESIGIKMCVNAGGNFEKTLKNTAELVRALLDNYDLPPESVVQHNFWGNKNCPKTLREACRWSDFLRMVCAERKEIGESESEEYSSLLF